MISGDLTQRARPEQFQAARHWVDRIPVPTLVVPGNHDVPLYRVWERVFAPFGAYRTWTEVTTAAEAVAFFREARAVLGL